MPEGATSRKTPTREREASVRASAGYFELATRPLHVLVFILPLVVACEIGSALYLADESGRVSEAVSAYLKVVAFFEMFGAFGLFLPGLALVAVLAVQHLLSRDRWRVYPGVTATMAVESLVLVAPLLVLGAVMGLAGAAAAAAGTPPAPDGAAGVLDGPWQQRLTIALGAGLYEEFLFRMVLIALVHAVAVDLLRRSEGVGAFVCVVTSALCFAAYHDLTGPAGGFDAIRAAFFALAGGYFAILYLWRGFGIVVGVHVLYDVVVLLIVRPGA
ncbi:MAG: hypothetical protein DHS20C14_19820 [Phycisphaeraceae bacterium]|nr:MAG: hypothetical protein DHS20C14_19820 [Phycisphaeraceae bacterium]